MASPSRGGTAFGTPPNSCMNGKKSPAQFGAANGSNPGTYGGTANSQPAMGSDKKG